MAFTQRVNKEGKKEEIFQCLGVGDNADMGDWTVEYSKKKIAIVFLSTTCLLAKR